MKLLVVVLFFASVATQSFAQEWTNVAVDKPAFQTLTRGRAFAGLAVDGNVVGNLGPDGSCSRTVRRRRNESAWWGVNLMRLYQVRRVTITLPVDVDVTSNVTILVGPSRINLTACNSIGVLAPNSTRTLRLRCVASNVRFLGIFRPNGGVIALCDVNLEGRLMSRRRDARLLSFNRTVLMSDPVSPRFGGALAVDGNINQNPRGGSCSMTRIGERAFWRVDLGRQSRIDRVVVYAMRTPRGVRLPLRNYIIQMSNDSMTGYRECETHFGIADSGSITVMPCADLGPTRFVRLRVRGVGRLAFCEVNVYGWRFPRTA